MDWMYNSADNLIDSEDYLLGKRIDKLPGEAGNNNFNVTYCSALASVRSSALPDGQADISRKLVEDPLNDIKTMEKLAKDKIIKCSMGMNQYALKGNYLTTIVDSEKNEEIDESGIDEYLTGIVMSQIAKIKMPLNIRRLYKETKGKVDEKESNVKNNNTRSPSPVHTNTNTNTNMNMNMNMKDKSNSNNKAAPTSRAHDASYTLQCKDITRQDKRKRITANKNTSSVIDHDDNRKSDKHHHRQDNINGYEQKNVRTGLNEEEKIIRRKEMQEDAKKYQKERKENVLRYEKEDILKASKDTAFSMNRKEFLNETMVSSGTLEKRIKSNLYNIQRQPQHMEKNFARR